jgi:predicted peptidase
VPSWATSALAIATLLGASAAEGGDPRLTKQVAQIDDVGARYRVDYWQFLPPRSHATKPPVLIFLHGRGERARRSDPSELDRVLKHGPPKLVAAGNDLCFGRDCFLMLAPQAPPGHDWQSPSVVRIVDAMIDRARALGADRSRIYLTGLSMGGHGAWSYAAAAGERIAAIVPIAGAAGGFTGCAIARAAVAVWAFHGAADEIVPPLGSIRGVREVNACKNPRPKERALLTLYRGVGHDSWTRTYDPQSRFDPKTGRPSTNGIDIYRWLLRHHRS